MKKITINLPEKMVEEIMILAAYMKENEFWSQAITWRQLLKKGLKYYKKDPKIAKLLSKGSKDNKNDNTSKEIDEEYPDDEPF